MCQRQSFVAPLTSGSNDMSQFLCQKVKHLLFPQSVLTRTISNEVFSLLLVVFVFILYFIWSCFEVEKFSSVIYRGIHGSISITSVQQLRRSCSPSSCFWLVVCLGLFICLLTSTCMVGNFSYLWANFAFKCAVFLVLEDDFIPPKWSPYGWGSA